MNPKQLLQPLHHSVPEDWDFRILELWTVPPWTLDTTRFISAPTSLKLGSEYGAWYNAIAMCQLIATQNLPQGRIITNIHTHTYIGIQPRVYLGITAPQVCEIPVILGGSYNGWKKYRCTWWTTYDYQNQPSTRVRAEYWDTDHWELTSENDYSLLSGDTNRIAIGSQIWAGNWGWHDDTQIWIPS